MVVRGLFWAAACGAALIATMPAGAAETPKRGGSLTYLISADAPPTFDGHRETTYATIHSVAPFYSVLIRINPDNPVENGAEATPAGSEEGESLVEPDRRQILVDVVARAHLPAFDIAAMRHDAVAP